MLMKDEREKIVEYSVKMLESGLTKGTSGNISIFNKELGYVAITPSGMNYIELTPEDVVIIDLNLNIIEGNRKPSSECNLHVEIYKTKKDIRSVVHTHSMYCTILSCLNEPLRAIHYVLADAGVSVVPVAPYKTYGTIELANAVASTIGDSYACLMKNHGMVSCGNNIESAFGLASTCEWVAEIQWKAMAVGTPHYLDDSQIDVVIKKFKGYGQDSNKDGGNGYFG